VCGLKFYENDGERDRARERQAQCVRVKLRRLLYGCRVLGRN
jgi:hypothetical protein